MDSAILTVFGSIGGVVVGLVAKSFNDIFVERKAVRREKDNRDASRMAAIHDKHNTFQRETPLPLQDAVATFVILLMDRHNFLMQ